MLTPECFKLILMRNRNTSKYASYYLFLQKIIKYYSSYQVLKFKMEKERIQNRELFKDDKIDNLSDIIKKQSIKIDKLLEKSDRQLRENGEINGKLDDIKETLENVTDRFVPGTEDEDKNDTFILVKNPFKPGKYHAIRCMKETKQQQLKEYLISESKKNKKEKVNISIEKYIFLEIDSPNAKNLWHRIKQSNIIKDKIRFIKNDMIKRETKYITEDEIKIEILKINDEKKQAMELI